MYRPDTYRGKPVGDGEIRGRSCIRDGLFFARRHKVYVDDYSVGGYFRGGSDLGWFRGQIMEFNKDKLLLPKFGRPGGEIW